MNSKDAGLVDMQLDLSIDNYAVMGNPVSHSKSPEIHHAFAAQTDQILKYQPILIPHGEFNSAIKLFSELGGKGLNITLPYKQEAYDIVTHISKRAKIASAVNTLTFNPDGSIAGDNTDGVGLVRDLQRSSILIKGKRLMIIGAGGAVRGVLGPLIEQCPHSIVITNRTLSRAKNLISGITSGLNIVARGLSELDHLDSFDLIINGTSSGLKGELPQLPDSLIGTNTSCYDMVYSNPEPAFITWCKSHGAKIAVDGLGMLVEQAAESFYIWRGVRPETEPVIKMLKNASLVSGR